MFSGLLPFGEMTSPQRMYFLAIIVPRNYCEAAGLGTLWQQYKCVLRMCQTENSRKPIRTTALGVRTFSQLFASEGILQKYIKTSIVAKAETEGNALVICVY